jgi:D-alanyl-lipoteichoic acid acyltransferase DltB (MBOAT superfamily)
VPLISTILPLSIDSITINSPAFGLLMLTLAAAGWLRVSTSLFVSLMAASGLVLAASWLTPAKAVIFFLSLGPAWIATRLMWARPDRGRTFIVGGLIAFQVTVLAITKLGPPSEQLGIAGTIGLSYLTFRQIHLLIVASHQSADDRFSTISWLGYLLNPWMLLAGPVQTWELHQRGLATLQRPSATEVLAGLHRISTGLIKILILAPIFRGQGDLSSLLHADFTWRDAVLAFYGYYIFLFLDFSGYVDVVLGSAELAGYKAVPKNFDKPYLATNFQDFWGRWNITLGLWFRTHVFTPVLAFLLRRWGLKREEFAIAVSLIVVFILIGLWHGLAGNYVMFGSIHAIGAVTAFLSRQWTLRRFGSAFVRTYEANRWLRPIRILICQQFVAATFILLDNDLQTVIGILRRIL